VKPYLKNNQHKKERLEKKRILPATKVIIKLDSTCKVPGVVPGTGEVSKTG
jgi:hypothetical protein